MTKIEYNGIPCWFKSYLYSEMAHKMLLTITDNKGTICPICRKEILPVSETYLCITNHKLFPNCYLHKECVGSTEQQFLIAIEKLNVDYQNALYYRDYYKHWFN